MRLSIFFQVFRRQQIKSYTINPESLFTHFSPQRALGLQRTLQIIAGLLQQRSVPLRVQIHWREEQCTQAPGTQRLRLRPGGGPERLRGRAL